MEEEKYSLPTALVEKAIKSVQDKYKIGLHPDLLIGLSEEIKNRRIEMARLAKATGEPEENSEVALAAVLDQHYPQEDEEDERGREIYIAVRSALRVIRNGLKAMKRKPKPLLT